jgi:hypothetical protein
VGGIRSKEAAWDAEDAGASMACSVISSAIGAGMMAGTDEVTETVRCLWCGHIPFRQQSGTFVFSSLSMEACETTLRPTPKAETFAIRINASTTALMSRLMIIVRDNSILGFDVIQAASTS